ncbi:biliverdin-producing heme oxygenase [Terrimonas sp. NA20]|uniref:Biliverdin-producing heme oxygenase n=1 Tax=Terrimonas ginsenosidimutans TaxID=2908004 RepID=A0ABS9KQK3_9BACT|nr:biliverdin-producing heme oxygenase [Terrimonas ginsenosidimutans]MCG2614615.1 biliverdin-producing heme oxygenase [Terrimonas ginsenosidimutans]
MLSSLLKEHTKESHQSLEAVVVRSIKAIRDKEGYINLLHKFYGFHYPLEQLQDQFLNDSNIPSYSDRRKASLILDDLKNLEAPLPNEIASSLPKVDSLSAALGTYYVMEGSTQGGSIVANMLIKHAGMSEHNTRFFYAYGEGGKQMWQSFKEKLDSYGDDPSFNDQVVKAADDTFTLFREWMGKV